MAKEGTIFSILNEQDYFLPSIFIAFPLLLLSLCLIFVSLINMFLGVFLLGFILYGTLGFLDLGGYFLSHFREFFFTIIPSDIFSHIFLLSSSSGTPMIWILLYLMFSQRSLRPSSFLYIIFLYFILLQLFLPFYLSAHLSILLPQLVNCWFSPVYF